MRERKLYYFIILLVVLTVLGLGFGYYLARNERNQGIDQADIEGRTYYFIELSEGKLSVFETTYRKGNKLDENLRKQNNFFLEKNEAIKYCNFINEQLKKRKENAD